MVVDGLVVEHGGDVGVLEEGVGGEDGVVGLDDGGGDLGRGVDGVAELGLLAVVDGEALEEEGAEAGAGATTDGVEDEEALEAGAVVGELADAVEAEVDDFLADGVVATGVVVGGVFLAGDELLGVEELAVGAGADLIDDGGFEVEHNAAGDVLAGAGFGEEGIFFFGQNQQRSCWHHDTTSAREREEYQQSGFEKGPVKQREKRQQRERRQKNTM